jgi:hypothetical protein
MFQDIVFFLFASIFVRETTDETLSVCGAIFVLEKCRCSLFRMHSPDV